MFKTISIAALLTLLVGCIIISPNTALQASLHGFNVWWNYVFPSLLPMYLLFEMLKAFGLIHALQHLLAPIIRSAGLSTAAGSSIIMSAIIGNPAGSEHTAKLLHIQKISLTEAKKLFLYSYLPNPIFVFVVIGAGFLGKPAIGFIIMLCIWTAFFISMLVHSLFIKSQPAPETQTDTSFLKAIERGQQEDGRGLGKLLGDGIYVSVQKLFITGGFMLFASVIGSYIQIGLQAIPSSLASLINVHFLLEPHFGSYTIIQTLQQAFSVKHITMLLCFTLSLGGLTTFLEAFAFMKQAKLSVTSFIVYRLLQGSLSMLLCSLAWTPLTKLSQYIYGNQALQSWFTSASQSTKTIPSTQIWMASLFISALTFLVLYMLMFTVSYIKDKQA